MVLEFLTREIWQEEEIEGIKIGKEIVKHHYLQIT
jgi:hypothetical protein